MRIGPVADRLAPPRALTERPEDTLRGIGIACLCYFILTLGDVAAKWVLPAAGLVGVMAGRGLFGALTVGGVAISSHGNGWRRLWPVRWKLVLFRSGLHSFVSLSWYIAWLSMSLADTYAVGFAAPLLMTVLAIPMLGERIRWRRALSTAVGFAGVLIMVRPGGELWTPTTLVLLAGIVAMAVSRNLTRVLSTTETPECLAFWLLAMHVPAAVLMLAVWPPPGFTGVGLLAIVFLGASNGIAHVLHSRAFALAPVSALAPYEYTPLLYGGLLGYFVFNEVPSWSTLGGAAVVAAAGLYNLHRERALSRAAIMAEPKGGRLAGGAALTCRNDP
jgi:drug/metabolite transporter (DMT)-like permease